MATKIELLNEFDDLVNQANQHNRKTKDRRFFPMVHARNGRTLQVGMYDYKKKKYALQDVKSIHFPKVIDEIRVMLKNA